MKPKKQKDEKTIRAMVNNIAKTGKAILNKSTNSLTKADVNRLQEDEVF